MMDQNQHLNKMAEAETPEKRKLRCCNGLKVEQSFVSKREQRENFYVNKSVDLRLSHQFPPAGEKLKK